LPPPLLLLPPQVAEAPAALAALALAFALAFAFAALALAFAAAALAIAAFAHGVGKEDVACAVAGWAEPTRELLAARDEVFLWAVCVFWLPGRPPAVQLWLRWAFSKRACSALLRRAEEPVEAAWERLAAATEAWCPPKRPGDSGPSAWVSFRARLAAFLAAPWRKSVQTPESRTKTAKLRILKYPGLCHHKNGRILKVTFPALLLCVCSRQNH
jgi:hypothetical protein